MRSTRFSFPTLALLAAVTTSAAAAETLTVVGQNDMVIDRPAIQAAVDAAQQGDTILLVGVFQLDGTPIFIHTSRLTVAGQVVDNDGDGAANEDPLDGLDNDGDSLVDEDSWDAVLHGIGDGFGGPARDVFPNRFNDGFEILGFDQALDQIEIRDLEFRQINRSVYLFPDYDDSGTVLLCDASSPRAGELDRVTIERNGFIDGFRGVEILGRVASVKVHDNWFSGISGQGVLLFGQQVGCAEADGSLGEFLPLGTPRKVDIADNQLPAVNIGVLSFISDMTSVRSNVIQANIAAVVSLEDVGMMVSHNELQGGFAGFLGTFDPRYEGPSSSNTISSNTISNGLFGIVVDCVSTGYRSINNEFIGSLFVDVLFDGTAPGGFCGGIGDSFENTLIATDFVTSVLDLGVDNRLLGTLAMISNPGISDEVRQQLAAIRTDLAKP